MLRDAGSRHSGPCGGQPRKHGGVLTFAKPDSWHTLDTATASDTPRYAQAEALAWTVCAPGCRPADLDSTTKTNCARSTTH